MWGLGLTLVAGLIASMLLLIRAYPRGDGGTDLCDPLWLYDLLCLSDPGRRSIYLAAIAGVTGGFTHSVISYSVYLGEGRLKRRWSMWYLVRPVIGGGLAVAFYFVLSGGIGSVNAAGVPDETGGVDKSRAGLTAPALVAISLLVGLFNVQAAAKLRSIAKAVFAPEDETRDKFDKNGKDDPDVEGGSNVPAANSPEPDSSDGGKKDDASEAHMKNVKAIRESVERIASKNASTVFGSQFETVKKKVPSPEQSDSQPSDRAASVPGFPVLSGIRDEADQLLASIDAALKSARQFRQDLGESSDFSI